MKQTDILIVGAGIAGTATACHLAGRGRSVILVDSTSRYCAPVGEVLAADARPELDVLGWTREVLDRGLAIYEVRSAWGKSTFSVPSILHPKGEGICIDRRDLLAVGRKTSTKAGAQLFDARIAGISGGPGEWIVDCGKHRFQARRLVDATGRSATLSRRMGATWTPYDRMVGLVGFAPAGTCNPVLSLASTPGGWFYSVPTLGGRAVTYLTDSDLVADGPDGYRKTFDAAIGAPSVIEAMDLPAEGLSWIGVRAARCGRLDRSAGLGWTAVGDAAESWDPLSGSGLHRALVSARQTADDICRDSESNSWTHSHSGFARHLSLRRLYYGRETRWLEQPFWERRSANDSSDDSISLDPEQSVPFPVESDRGQARAEAYLSPAAVGRLMTLCGSHRVAHEILAEFRTDPDYPGDREAVLALSRLVDSGTLVAN